MSGGRAIDPLPLDQFPTEADSEDPGFEELFNQLVGDAGTPADGFEDDLAIANTLLDDLDSSLGELGGQDGGTLDDTFADILAVDPAPAGDDVVALQAAIPTIDSNVDNLGNLLAGAGLPTPPGSVAGGAGGCSSYDFGSVPTSTAAGAATYQVQMSLQNNGAAVVTVKGVTFNPPTGGVFTVNPLPNGQQIQPGASLTLNVFFTPGLPGSYATTMTILTDAPDPQPCVNLTGTGTGSSLLGGPPGQAVTHSGTPTGQVAKRIISIRCSRGEPC